MLHAYIPRSVDSVLIRRYPDFMRDRGVGDEEEFLCAGEGLPKGGGGRVVPATDRDLFLVCEGLEGWRER